MDPAFIAVFICFLVMLGLNIYLNSLLTKVRKQRNRAEAEVMSLHLMEMFYIIKEKAMAAQIQMYKDHISDMEKGGGE